MVANEVGRLTAKYCLEKPNDDLTQCGRDMDRGCGEILVEELTAIPQGADFPETTLHVVAREPVLTTGLRGPAAAVAPRDQRNPKKWIPHCAIVGIVIGFYFWDAD